MTWSSALSSLVLAPVLYLDTLAQCSFAINGYSSIVFHQGTGSSPADPDAGLCLLIVLSTRRFRGKRTLLCVSCTYLCTIEIKWYIVHFSVGIFLASFFAPSHTHKPRLCSCKHVLKFWYLHMALTSACKYWHLPVSAKVIEMYGHQEYPELYESMANILKGCKTLNFRV